MNNLRKLFANKGRDKSIEHNRIHGEYRVMYPDGLISQPMCRDVAEDYVKIYGGKVIPK